MTLPAMSYKRHRFPPQIIAHAVWLYFRFPLSLRFVEEMLLERGLVVSYETIRRRAIKFGPDYTRRLAQIAELRRYSASGRGRHHNQQLEEVTVALR